MKPFIHLPFRALALLATIMVCSLADESLAAESEPELVRVMSLNLWHGGDGGKQPLDQMVTLIRRSQADLVGLQETAGFAPQGQPRPDRTAEIARRLGWHHVEQGGRTGIVSRFEIVAVTPRKWGIKVKLPSGRHLYHFNAHLFHSPYQPYQLLGIPYGNAPFLKTGEAAVQAARETRGGEVARMLAEVKTILPDGLPVFITGDFNEPSHLDWTPASVKAGHCPLSVLWPSTQAVEAAGFIDTYRAVYPDPVKNRGLTWTPRTRVDDPKDRHDRIDFVFVGGPPSRVRSARIVGESPEYADVVVTSYPSDHRAVVSEVEFPAGK
ncbi:MAG: endonuclease/exonuclease/phosphatase family protein [Verrucomicrobiota bacterium]